MESLDLDGLYQQLGWYGKLPTAGDFVHRRIDSGRIQFWHQWIEQSLLPYKQAVNEAHCYPTAPVWNFVLPASLLEGGAFMQMGCLAPSLDRVGRIYPLVITLQIPTQCYQKTLLQGAARYFQQMGRLAYQAIQQRYSVPQFDAFLVELAPCMTAMLHQPLTNVENEGAILSILNAGHERPPLIQLEEDPLAWPELVDCFHPQTMHSYWWTNQATGAAHRAVVHGGRLTPLLFQRLFGVRS